MRSPSELPTAGSRHADAVPGEVRERAKPAPAATPAERLLRALPTGIFEVIIVGPDGATTSVNAGAEVSIVHLEPVPAARPVAATRRGLEAAQGEIVVVGHDLAGAAGRIVDLVEPIRRGHADIALTGRRAVASGAATTSPSRNAGGHTGPGAAARLRRLSEPNAQLLAIRRDLLAGITFDTHNGDHNRNRNDDHDGDIIHEILLRAPWQRPAELAMPGDGVDGPEPGHAGRSARVGRSGRRAGVAARRLTRLRLPASGHRLPRSCHAVLGGFFLLQVALIVGGALKGPFLDEGIYVTAGRRTLEGGALVDGYLTWFAGHLLWPVLSALAYQLGGLAGSRLLAALLVTAAIWAAARATTTLYGARAAPWAAALLATSASFLHLGHLAVYDAAAMAFLALAIWFLLTGITRDHRGWLAAGALTLGLAIVAKYPVAVFAVPAVAMVALMRRGRGAVGDLLLLAAVSGVVLLAMFLPTREQLTEFVSWRLEHDPDFGVTRAMIATEAAVLVAPVAFLAAVGVYASARRFLTVPFVAPLAAFPAYHVLAGNAVGLEKHVGYGLLLAAPVAGAGLAWLFNNFRPNRALVPVAMAGLLAAGVVHMRHLDAGWLDTSEGAAYLRDHVDPTDVILASNKWPLMPALYLSGAIEDVAQVWDAYQLQNEDGAPTICDADWVVHEQGSIGWPPEILGQFEACGDFERVFLAPDRLRGRAADLRYAEWGADLVILRNIGRGA